MTARAHALASRVAFFTALAVASGAYAQITITGNVSDTFGNSSFDAAAPNDVGYVPVWSNGAYPSAGNTYITGDGRIRTPDDGGSYTFGGDSLTVNNTNAREGGLMYKGTGTTGVLTINNLILDGGRVAHQNGVGDLFQLAGAINVVSASTLDAKQGNIDISATVSGSGGLTIPVTDASAENNRYVTLLANNAGYSGSIDVAGRFRLGATGGLTFDIGASGVNNRLSGTGTAVYDGAFTFDLTGATSNPTDSWSISGVANQSYGATFSVTGFTQAGGFWGNGTYLFDTATGTLSIGALPTAWNVDADGAWNTPANWSGGVPTAGGIAVLGSNITAPRTVSLNVNSTLGTLILQGANAYTLAPAGGTLTLNGDHEVSVTSGVHTVSAPIAGTAGLVKTGAGDLVLAGVNSYSGQTDVQQGILRLQNSASVNGAVSLAAGTALFFQGDGLGGGYNGAFAGDISGDGAVELSQTLTAANTVTFNNAKSYTGATQVRSGTLVASGPLATFGASSATAATGTRVFGGDTATGKVALTGGANVAGEVLTLEGRQNAAIAAPHLTNVAGANTWSGNIVGTTGGGSYNIESQAGTLTLSGTLSAPDTGDRAYVFSGAGNTVIGSGGRIVDTLTNADGVPDVVPVNNLNNVSVVKRGAGTLTIATATGVGADYHRGDTTIEEGTLRVQGDGATNGELLSRTINVRSGARFEVDGFTQYNQQPGQTIGGAGTIDVLAGAMGLFSHGGLNPGDSVGTLTVADPISVGAGLDSLGVWRYELGDTAATVGGAENDLLQVNGAFSVAGSPNMTLEIAPVEGDLQAGSYRLVNYTGAAANVAGLFQTVRVVNQRGDILSPRQTLSVASVNNQVNLVVTGDEGARTWNGAAGNNTWASGPTPTNWTGGDSTFRDLDDVTFGAAGIKSVVLNSTVAPGATNFSGGVGTTYTVSGTGGITGHGPVNVNSGTVKLTNTGNDYVGLTTVAAGATLEIGSASVGSVNVVGTLAVNGASANTLVDNFSVPGLTEYTQSAVNDTLIAASNVTFSDATGALAATYAGANGVEQLVLLRDDFSLAVGQTLVADVAIPVTAQQMDFGLAVSSIKTPAVATVGDTDVRDTFEWGSVSVRPSQDAIRVNSVVNAVLTTGAGVLAAPEATVSQLFIERVSETQFQVGYVDTSANRVVSPAVINFLGTDVGTAIGFYADVRNAGSLSALDNLRITSGSGGQALEVNGALTLGAASELLLDITSGGFDSLLVSGAATLDGTIKVSLAPDFTPVDGAQFTILSAGSINNLGVDFMLPANFSALVDADSIVLTYSLGLDGDYNGDGVVNAADYVVWRDGDSPDSTEAGYTLWRDNFGATSPGASSAQAPEPAAALLLLAAAAPGVARRRRG